MQTIENKTLAFVALTARCRKYGGGPLTCLNVTADYTEATDGHRLNRVAQTFGLAPGVYNIIKATKRSVTLEATDFQYPETSRAIPKYEDDTCYFAGSLHSAVNRAAKSIPAAFGVNPSLFPDEKVFDYKTASVYPMDGFKPVVLTSQDILSIVMPFRM